jgi:hypothetical protein
MAETMVPTGPAAAAAPADHNLDEEAWVFPDRPEYKHYLLHFMSFLHNRLPDPYPKETTFTKEQLLAVQPHHVRKWLNLRAYGLTDPAEHLAATGCRSSSLMTAKHALSFYMPNKHVPWIEGLGGNSNGGNPTRHRSVSEVIKKVKKKECRGQGKPANDKRAYNKAEFYKVLELFRAETDWDHQYKFSTMALLAYHLIHRLDDTCHLTVDAPHGCIEFPFVIQAKTKWSKNVQTELQCPDQYLFGADDWRICPQLHIALYLEGWLQRNPNAKHMFTDNDDPEAGPANLNKQYGNRIKVVVWSKEEFKLLEDQTGPDQKGLGTHSNRKYASTRASRLGARKDQVNFRGRWIGDTNKTILGRVYISPDDYYTDALVASYLCEGGPIKYMLRPNDGRNEVHDYWLFTTLVPNIRRRYESDDRLCRVFALAKLWAVFDETAAEDLPLAEVERIKHSFAQNFGERDGNPVVKIQLEIMNVNGNLQVVASAANTNDRIDTNNNANDAINAGPQPQAQPQQQQQQRGAVTQILSLVQHNHQESIQRFELMQAEIVAQRAWMQQMFDRVITNQRRYGGTVHSAFARSNRQEEQRRDLQQQRAAADAAAAAAVTPEARPPRAAGPGTVRPRQVGRTIDREARLVKQPRCLYELWQEYQFGIGNNKPAKNFTSAERNNRDNGLKQKYHYRSKVWKVQSYMVNAGWNVEAMNAEITRVYNTSFVTAIIKGITADEKNPQHPMVESVGFSKFRVNPQLYAGPRARR